MSTSKPSKGPFLSMTNPTIAEQSQFNNGSEALMTAIPMAWFLPRIAKSAKARMLYWPYN